MDNKIYKITLADGSIIENLTLNGNNFISTDIIDAAIFEDNCSPVVINDGEADEIHKNMELVQCKQYGNEYWFILRDISEKEFKEKQFRSDLEYLAMMCGVEL